jgi:hypothetical protein
MAIQLSPNGKWLYGDTPGTGGKAAVLAETIVATREELIGEPPAMATWVHTSQGVATLFDGAQALVIYNAIKDIVIKVV